MHSKLIYDKKFQIGREKLKIKIKIFFDLDCPTSKNILSI